MTHPPAVIEKAQRLERLLLRLEEDEPLEQVRVDLGLSVETEDIARLQAKYEAGGRSWEALIDGRHGHPQKAHSALREWMYERKREDESLTAGELAVEIEEQFQVELSIGHINYLLRKVELAGPRGRPYRRGARNRAGDHPHVGLYQPCGHNRCPQRLQLCRRNRLGAVFKTVRSAGKETR